MLTRMDEPFKKDFQNIKKFVHLFWKAFRLNRSFIPQGRI